MHRREFGRALFKIAAATGLTTISFSRSGLALLSGCAAESDLASTSFSSSLRKREGKVSALIIGSGYGAAVTALRLTEAGFAVTMLEAGRLWEPGPDGKRFCTALSPDGRAMWFQDSTEAMLGTVLGFPIAQPVPREAGILQVSGSASMRVYRGKGVGGGSLVNMAMCVPPTRDKLASTLPMVDADAFFDTYLPRAESVLGPGKASVRMLRSDYYRYSRVGIEIANLAGYRVEQLATGYDVDYLDMELDGLVPRSALDGEAGFGNNYGKKSLDKTYLADALATGLLTIHALHVVKTIRVDPSGGYVVDVEQIDIQGNVLARKELTCTHLFVGAGSMGTSELLVRARARGDLPNLNQAIGSGWGPNGDIFCNLDNPLSRPTGDKQCTLPSHRCETLDQLGRLATIRFTPLPLGIPNWVTTTVMLADNPERGHFTYDSTTDQVSLQWDRAQSEPSITAARFVYDRINIASGTKYSDVVQFANKQPFNPDATYHPLGGAPLSEATDDYGRIREHPGLYIVDGSLIPVGIGTNPLLTITALAERNIERVIAEDLLA